MPTLERRRFLKSIAALTASASLPRLSRAKSSSAERRPNILILQPDQHSYHVMGCSGNQQAKTPHLDQLARQSAFFKNAVATSPVCCPWRASMQTGLYWHTHGVDRNNVQLSPDFTCFAEILSAHGYRTGYIGKWHLDGGIPEIQPGGFIPPGPRRQGWQDWNGYQKNHEYFDVWRYDDQGNRVGLEDYDWEPTWHTDMAIEFIKRNEAANQPWCYYVAYGPPHKPNQCPQRYLDLYDPASFVLTPAQRQRCPDKVELRRELQIYYGQVSAIDHEVGRLRAFLQQSGVAKDTIVLYVSDHGDVLGSHGDLRGKAKPYTTAFRVPTFFCWDGVIPPQLSPALIGAPDLPATLLDLAGLERPSTWQGRSYAAHCLGKHQPLPQQALLGLRHWNGVWDGRHVYSEGDPHCLYDHLQDPYELNNLVGLRSLRTAMQAKLREAKLASGWPAA